MNFTKYFLIILLQFNINNSFTINNYILPIKNLLKKNFSNHKNLGYNKSKEILFKEFKNNLIYGKFNNNKKNINCEHLWCQKYFEYKEPMKSDLHILYLSDSKINSHRQDYKFSDINYNFIFLNNKGEKIQNNFFSKLISNKLCKKNNNKKLFEPPNYSKGKITRSIAYYDLIYENYNTNIEEIIGIKELIEWNRYYFPNIDEIKRNEIIRNYQNNINPYIKYPILIELFYNNNISLYNISKLFIITLYTIIFSDLFRIKYIIKKILYNFSYG